VKKQADPPSDHRPVEPEKSPAGIEIDKYQDPVYHEVHEQMDVEA